MTFAGLCTAAVGLSTPLLVSDVFLEPSGAHPRQGQPNLETRSEPGISSSSTCINLQELESWACTYLASGRVAGWNRRWEQGFKEGGLSWGGGVDQSNYMYMYKKIKINK